MTNEEYEQLLSETDTTIDRLHALYEQWFQGIERREPAKQRDLVHKRVDLLRNHMPRNTALRFRGQGIIARWVTLSHHWTKISRQIEEGTYKRDVFRAKQKAAERAAREKLDASRRRPQATSPAEEAAPAPVAAATPIAPAEAESPSADRAASTHDDEGAAAVVIPRFSGGRDRGVAAGGAAPPRPQAPGRPVAPPRPLSPSAPDATSTAAPAPSSAPVASPWPPPSRPRTSSRPAPPMRPAPPAAPARPAPPAAPARPAPPAPPAPPRPVAPAASPAASSGPDMRGLFDRYVEAKRQNNERTDNVRLESLASSIEKMLPDLQKKHAGKKIDFEIVVKDGRVGLKPVPK